ncbi:S24 family peptidase [Delftia tsuruhatensis]|jgi:hypothetical protein|uniref:S24 family peptidase n=1 Tax=Delftia tsuruhatensis TaxID=180282 RepID=UPI0012C54F55|nr:S24 family peptidase [Delftia tsuruhatensis]MPT06039.1 S24 family peptidase [Delftia sp.]
MAIRKVKITPETQEESLRLRAIWDGAQGRPNQAAFGEMYDIGNQSAVGQFLRGETPISLKAAVGFAKGLGCEIQDFSPRLAKLAHEASQVLGNDDEAEFITVRHVAIKFSNGTGRIVVDEGTKPPLPFRTDFLKALGISQRNAVVVDADGDSNVPSIYEHGVVLIDRGQTEIVNGKFYAFRVNGNLLIKKLTRLDDGAILAVSENRAYEPRVYRQGEDFEVLGRARWTCHQL